MVSLRLCQQVLGLHLNNERKRDREKKMLNFLVWKTGGLYYNFFTIIIYNCNDGIQLRGHYYKTINHNPS
jgi:hypothetical protein